MLIGEAIFILSDTDGTATSVFPPFCSGGAAGALDDFRGQRPAPGRQQNPFQAEVRYPLQHAPQPSGGRGSP
jgi:hypothetical protein